MFILLFIGMIGVNAFSASRYMRIGNFAIGNSTPIGSDNQDPVLRITLDTPEFIFLGDQNTIKLTVRVLAPDLLERSVGGSRMIAARLDLNGGKVTPSGLVSETMDGNNDLSFYWTITPLRKGKITGQAWVYLIANGTSSGEPSSIPISAKPIEIEVIQTLGGDPIYLRMIGIVIFLLACTFLGYILLF